MARKNYGNTPGPKRRYRRIQKSTISVQPLNTSFRNNQHYRVGDTRYDIRGNVSQDGVYETDGNDIQLLPGGTGGSGEAEEVRDSGGEANENQKTEVPYKFPEAEEALIYNISPRPSLVEAIKCKCCECSANYGDGRVDCKIQHCPLYARMPYRRLLPDFSWVFGKFSKTHSIKCEASKITQEQYIDLCLDFFLTKKLSKKIKRISLTQIIRAKCYDCCCDYVVGVGTKGRVDCGLQNCSLYYWTPYREEKPSYNWMFDIPYTSRHRIAINALRINRNEYIRRVLVEGERL